MGRQRVKMLKCLVFVLLPMVVCATRLCDGHECNARHERIAGGDESESHGRPFQVRKYYRSMYYKVELKNDNCILLIF